MSISPEPSPASDPFLSFDEVIANAPDGDEPTPAPSNIIPIRQEEGKPSVNARDLHAFLEVGKDFSTWIKDRIETFGFIEGEDYSPISGNRSDGLPGKARIDYLLTLDMAKELSMVERTPRGKQARQYFIECEKNLAKASAGDLLTVLRNPAAMKELLMDYADKVIHLEEQVTTLAPKAAGLERLAGTAGTYCITDAAKSLGILPKRLFEFLEERHWIYRRAGGWHPMQAKQNSGLMDCKIIQFEASDGTRSNSQARITAKGLARLSELLTK